MINNFFTDLIITSNIDEEILIYDSFTKEPVNMFFYVKNNLLNIITKHRLEENLEIMPLTGVLFDLDKIENIKSINVHFDNFPDNVYLLLKN